MGDVRMHDSEPGQSTEAEQKHVLWPPNLPLCKIVIDKIMHDKHRLQDTDYQKISTSKSKIQEILAQNEKIKRQAKEILQDRKRMRIEPPTGSSSLG